VNVTPRELVCGLAAPGEPLDCCVDSDADDGESARVCVFAEAWCAEEWACSPPSSLSLMGGSRAGALALVGLLKGEMVLRVPITYRAALSSSLLTVLNEEGGSEKSPSMSVR
jgi:hypothetical protein